MNTSLKTLCFLATITFACMSALAAVTDQEAAKLKTILTPLGAEREGNAAGTIPAWTGSPLPAIPTNGGRKGDPFAADKPLYSITAANLAQYAGRLTEGQKAMFAKYPEYRIDVFPTRRTAIAPHWIYDNTFKNATRAKTTKNGFVLEGAHGGVPFPIPKTGTEAMWNHLMRWEGETFQLAFRTYITTSAGQRVLASDSEAWQQYPYYFKDGFGQSNDVTETLRMITHGPAQKAGEAIVLYERLDPTEGRPTWQYLTGQRRVRKLPNVAYDTPSFIASGVSNFDEIYGFSGPMDRYDWKIVGKQELIVPYNNNRFFVPAKDSMVLGERYLSPDHVRWELHRVWVVEATLASGKRHVMPKRRFYLDEDTWQSVLADGWDAKGQIWKTFWYLNQVVPELPGVVAGPFGHYNLQSGDWIANLISNEKSQGSKYINRLPSNFFTPDALSAESVR